MPALFDAVRRSELDTLTLSEQPLDVLAQRIVAEGAGNEWETGKLLAPVRRAWPCRDLRAPAFESVLDVFAAGFTTRRGRASAAGAVRRRPVPAQASARAGRRALNGPHRSRERS